MLQQHVMGQLTLPPNLNNSKQPEPISNPSTPKPKLKQTEEIKKESRFSFTEEPLFSVNEKFKLFLIIIAAVAIPVLGTFSYTSYSYQKELQKYKQFSESQIETLRNQINILTNPSVKQLEQYENIIKAKSLQYNKEKETLEKDTVYQDIIKKTKELDKQIIICNVHLHNIEIVKQNNYKEVDSLLEKLNKENIK